MEEKLLNENTSGDLSQAVRRTKDTATTNSVMVDLVFISAFVIKLSEINMLYYDWLHCIS
jgi:hypothetical protein